MPKIDISLPKGKMPEGDIDVEGQGGKGGKFQMPTFDISLPKMKSPGAEIDVEGPDLKGGKFNMPKIDISLPKGKMPEGEIDVEGRGGKGGKFQMPSFDISLPKMKSPGAEIDVEGPDLKGGKFNMPKIDISLPKGKMPEGEMDVEGRGGKFQMPKFDISLPKMKSPEGDMVVEGSGGKGAKINMPKVDISLPNIKLPEGDVSIPKRGMDTSDARFSIPSLKMPNIDINMPKVDLDLTLPKGKKDTSLEKDASAPEPSGGFDMPDVHLKMPKISMPNFGVKGKDKEMDADLKLKGKAVDIEGPEIKVKGPGLPKPSFGMTFGKGNQPDTDIATPKDKIDISHPDVGADVKLPKVKLPKIDISTPKLPDVDIHFKKLKGKSEVSTDADLQVRGPAWSPKGPSVEINMPKLPKFGNEKEIGLKPTELDIECPDMDLKGSHKGTVKLEGSDADISGPGGNFKLPTVKIPTVDISAPKVNLDFGLPKSKGDDREKIELLKAEGSRPSSGASFEVPDVSLKMPKFSLPKFGGKSKSRDLELEGQGPKANIKLSPPQLEGEGREPSVELEVDGKTKGKVKLPKIPGFGISKKEGEATISVPGAKIKKGKVDIKKPNIDVESPEDKTKYKLKFPKFKISSPKGKLPEGEAEISVDSETGGKGNIHAPDVTIKMPKFSMPKFGNMEGDLDICAPDAQLDTKGKVKMPSVEISLPTAKVPEGEVLLPKAEVDVSEADIKGYEGNLKIPKMPTIDISVPKIDLDVALPKAKHSGDVNILNVEVDGDGGKFKMPKIKMPQLDISVPKGPSGDIDFPDVDIEGEGGKFKMPKIKMPQLDISVPKGPSGDIDFPDVDIEGEGGKFKMPKIKMPKVDISVPKGHSGDIDFPDMDVEGEGGKFKMPKIKMPQLDISVPKGHSGDIDFPDVDIEGDGGNFKMPKIKMPQLDISVPKVPSGDIDFPDMDVEGEGGKFKMPKIKMPQLDISVPKGHSGDIDFPDVDVEGKGSKFKIPTIKMPKVDISIPKRLSGHIDVPNIEVEGGESKFKMPKIKMPNVDISVPKGRFADTDASLSSGELDIDSSKGNVEHSRIKIPSIDIKGPKGDFELDISLPKADGGKQQKKIELPDLDIQTSGSYGKIKGPKVKGTKFKIGMPKIKTAVDGGVEVDGKTPEKEGEGSGGRFKFKKPKFGKVTTEVPDVDADGEGKDAKFRMPQISLPNVGFSTSREAADTPEIHGPEISGKLPKFKMPDVEISGPKIKGQGEAGMKDTDINLGRPDDKERIKLQMPKITLPTMGFKEKSGSTELIAPNSDSEDGISFPKLEIKAPKLPELDFDIRSPQAVAEDAEGDTDKKSKIKIPKFGVALPTIMAPEATVNINAPDSKVKGAAVKLKAPEIPTGVSGAEVEYEGPKMPKVKKAVFVLLNPKTDGSDVSASPSEGESSVEPFEAKVRVPKIKMKPSFGKSSSKDKGKSLNGEEDADGDGKSKGGKLKMPKVTFSPGKMGSFDVTGSGSGSEGSVSNVNGEKDMTFQNGSKEDKSKFGKLKLPKIEFSSPYTKNVAGEEDTEMSMKLVKKDESLGTDRENKGIKSKSSKITLPGFKKKAGKGEEAQSSQVVSSTARTEMLTERGGSESPTPKISIGFVSGRAKGQAEADTAGADGDRNRKETDSRERSPKFKVPKFSLSPRSTGILHITPESSPQGSKSSLQCAGEDEASTGIRIQMPRIGFSTQQTSEERIVTTSKEGSVTVVTKSSKYTMKESGTGQAKS
ncbi:hypothetical protein AAFF_G00037980 [Aldrovandia affinis]|uniref:Neuroblast differentiation-associated protein AHNAK n=1 Tax=Aldrovandia affinis TaxID=143900 RepID=A0AAD7WYP4_9TELE|nr:hypothetical protein AAFF_G00037980 [Aldrovandia affinis]